MGNNRDTATAEILTTYQPADSVPSRSEYLTMTEAARHVLEDIISRHPALLFNLPAGTHHARNLWLKDYREYVATAAQRRAVLLHEVTEHYRNKKRLRIENNGRRDNYYRDW